MAGALRQSLAGFIMNQQNFSGLAEASIRPDGRKQLAVLGFMVIPLVVCGVVALVLRRYGWMRSMVMSGWSWTGGEERVVLSPISSKASHTDC